MDICLKFTNTWKLANFSKSTKSHLDRFVDFIIDHSFLNRTDSESSQNFDEVKSLVPTFYIQTFEYIDSFTM